MQERAYESKQSQKLTNQSIFTLKTAYMTLQFPAGLNIEQKNELECESTMKMTTSNICCYMN
jgi:hypothetical protein